MPTFLKQLKQDLMLKHNISWIHTIISLHNTFCLGCAVMKNTAPLSIPFYFKPAFVVTSTAGIQ